MCDTETRFYRAFEAYTDHAIKRPAGTRMQARNLLDDLWSAIMPSNVLAVPDQDRLDRLQFLLDSNPPAAFMVVALVDELDRMATATLPEEDFRAAMEAELADVRRALSRTAANIRAEMRGDLPH